MPIDWRNMGRGGAIGSLWGDAQSPPGGSGIMSEPTRSPQQDARLAFASQMLQGSGGQSGNFAQIMGQALMASRQARLETQQMQARQKAVELEGQQRQQQLDIMGRPQAPDVPAAVQEYQQAVAGGFKGSFFDYQRQLRQAGATNVKTEVNPAQYPNSFSEALGKSDVETLGRYQKGAEGAAKFVGTLGQLEKLNPTAMSGGGANTKAEVANWISGLTGVDIVDPKVLSNTQTYNAVVSKAVLDSLGGSLGTGVSNADVTFIKNTVPSLEYSKEARQQLIDYLRQRASQEIELYDRARAYGEKNLGLRGFQPYPIAGRNPGDSPARTLIPGADGVLTYDPGAK